MHRRFSEGTCTIAKTFYKNDGTPLQGVRVIVTKVVKNGRIINRGPVIYLSDASGAVSFKVPQGSKVYMNPSEFNTPGGVLVNIPDSSGWTYTFDSPQPLGSSMMAAGLIVERNDITVGSTPKDTLDFSTTFNVSASPNNEANVSINHDSLKARPGSKLTYLHDLFVDRGLTAWDETSLANAHTKALDSNFVLIVPPDYPASTMTFSASDASLKLINYDTLNITTNQTIPKGASIVMAGTGVFNISSGDTLTFASGSRFDGGLQTRFIGSGTVKFQEDVVEAAYPQWWGVLGDSSTVSTSGFQKALNSGVKKISVRVPAGTYIINDSLQIPSNVDFFGENATIVSTDTSKKVLTAGPLVKNIKISGFTIRYNAKPAVRKPNTSAFFIRECDTLEISHNRILFAPGMGVQIVACKSVKVHHNRVEKTLADGIHITNGLNSDTQRHIWSEDFIITDNIVVDTGDDHIAVASYKRPLNASDPAFTNWNGSQQQIRRGVIANNIVRGALTKYRTRGIVVNGGRDIVVDNNVIEGHPTVGDTNQTVVISGILVQGVTAFKYHRPARVKITNNIIIKSTANHTGENFELENGGIKVFGADSVEIINNTIDWSTYMFGIFVRADTSLSEYDYQTLVRDLVISGNTIYGTREGIKIFTPDTFGVSANWHNRILIKDNKFFNSQIRTINADRVKNILVENNHIFGTNISNTANVAVIRLSDVDEDVIVKNNYIRSSNSTQYGVQVSLPRSTADILEKDNTFNLTTTTTNVVFGGSPGEYAATRGKRIHYIHPDSTTQPRSGTWEAGDIAINSTPGNGEVAYWICTASGSPGTWKQGTAVVNGLGINDTTEYRLSTSGAATITGVTHVRLDTYADTVASQTVTALNGRIGQLAIISTKNANRDIVFIDDDNKFDLNQKYVRLQSPKDVLFLLAYSANQWKQVGYFAGNTRQNRFSVEDTVGMVLHAAGTDTVAGIGNLILDTFGGAALDTVTTLTGTAGQIIYISTRAGSRDIRFLDSGNFSLAAERLLDTMYDVLVLKATTTTTWKEVSFSNNQ